MGLRRLLGDGHLYSVGEFHTGDDFWQLGMAIELAPAALGALDQLEDHGEGGFVRQTPFGADGAMADGREGALDWVRGAQVLPMFRGEIVEGQERVPILAEAIGRLGVFEPVGLDEGVEGALGRLARRAP